MMRVIVESPYAGDVERNRIYLRRCLRDCLLRGEAPYASHGLYTQPSVLRDEVLEERNLGIEAGFAWHGGAHAMIVFTDYGVSPGMQRAIDQSPIEVEYREIGPNP